MREKGETTKPLRLSDRISITTSPSSGKSLMLHMPSNVTRSRFQVLGSVRVFEDRAGMVAIKYESQRRGHIPNKVRSS
jgi:hypothetical protein